jgi:hypothetical protein
MTDGSPRVNDSEIMRTQTETAKIILLEIDDLKKKVSMIEPLGSWWVLFLSFIGASLAIWIWI